MLVLTPWATRGGSGKGFLLEAHQMQKLGHPVPEGSQAPVAIRSLHFSPSQNPALALWIHTAKTSAYCKSNVWEPEAVAGGTDKQEPTSFVIISPCMVRPQDASWWGFYGHDSDPLSRDTCLFSAQMIGLCLRKSELCTNLQQKTNRRTGWFCSNGYCTL